MIGLCYLGLKEDTRAKEYVQKSIDMGFVPELQVTEYLNLDVNVD
jgi:hypothetical protein